MIEITACPFCRSTSSAIPHNTVTGTPYVKVDTELGEMLMCPVVHYVECISCGLIYQTPRLDDRQLFDYYSKGIYRKWNGADDRVGEKQRAASVWETLKPMTKNAHSHVDVGCGHGYLLSLSLPSLDAWGVEWDKSYVDQITEDRVLSSLSDAPHSFDLLTSIHVLEHVSDPVSELRYYYDALSVGGRMIVEVPSSISQGSPYRLSHTFVFRPHVLGKMVQMAGFKVEAYMLVQHQRIIAVKEA